MGITDNENFIPVNGDGVWVTSATQMNLLYAMSIWASKNGIINQDDWEDFINDQG